MTREKVLLGGDTNTSKSMSLVSLALIYPERKTIILDPDDGIDKVVEEMGIEDAITLTPVTARELGSISRDDLPALTVIPITPDWDALINTYRMVKKCLIQGDWMCLDMMGRFWDFSQNYYSRMVFGQTPLEHILRLKKQAENTSFGGFEGLTDWPIIKRMHNEELVDDALLWSPFNVMATTSINTFLPVEKVPKGGVEGVLAAEFGIKLEGEKHNPYRFDTIAILTRKKDSTFHFRLAKDKGREVDIKQDFDITDSNFWASYLTFRGRTQ